MLSIDIPLALRLRNEIDAELWRIVQTDQWVQEGGLNLLPYAIQRADGIISRDPPLWPRSLAFGAEAVVEQGATRPEVPEGNIDWPFAQYKFAIRSLRNHAKFRNSISVELAGVKGLRLWRVRNGRDLRKVIDDGATPPVEIISTPYGAEFSFAGSIGRSSFETWGLESQDQLACSEDFFRNSATQHQVSIVDDISVDLAGNDRSHPHR